ncbi:MAG: AAA family ATPase [Nitrososphaeraceae archaeon]
MNLGITGNPGVGKHTIAEKFSKEITELSCIIDINKIIINNKLFTRYKNGEQEIDLDEIKLILRRKLQENYKKYEFIIVIGHLLPYVIDPKDIDFIIILRKSPYSLMDVFKERKYSLKKSKENVASEILGICSYDTIKAFTDKKILGEIDTTSQTTHNVVQKIIKLLKNKEKETVGEIDWFEVIYKKNDWKYFFEY